MFWSTPIFSANLFFKFRAKTWLKSFSFGLMLVPDRGVGRMAVRRVAPKNLGYYCMLRCCTNHFDFIYIYIFVMSVLPVWIPGSLPGSGTKHASRTRQESVIPRWNRLGKTNLFMKKKSRFARAVRPQRAKTRSAYYISHFNMTI